MAHTIDAQCAAILDALDMFGALLQLAAGDPQGSTPGPRLCATVGGHRTHVVGGPMSFSVRLPAPCLGVSTDGRSAGWPLVVGPSQDSSDDLAEFTLGFEALSRHEVDHASDVGRLDGVHAHVLGGEGLEARG